MRVFALLVGVLLGCGSTESSPSTSSSGGSAQGGQTPDAAGGSATTRGGALGSGGVLSLGGGGAHGGVQTLAGASSFGGALGQGGNAPGGGFGAAGVGTGGTNGDVARGGRGSGGAQGSGGVPACMLRDDPQAPWIPFTRTSESAPAAVGGVIGTGTYHLTKLVYHGGTRPKECIPKLFREILRVQAASTTQGTMHTHTAIRYEEDESGRTDHPSEFTYTTAGSKMMASSTCGFPNDFTENYNATLDQVQFIRGPFDAADCDLGVTLVLTYQKVP